MKKSVLLIVVTAGLFSCKQGNNPAKENAALETSLSIKNTPNDKDGHTKYEYADSNGQRMIIQNGYPRGGTKYVDSKGDVYGYAVFWTRIINATDNPLELKIDLPLNSYEISNFRGQYFKILVPADTITPDKIPLINLTDLETFLDNNMHKSTSLKRTIDPKESSGFYFIMLISTIEPTGMTRSGLSLKGQDLFYKISRYSSAKLIDEKEIHCGRINLKNLRFDSPARQK